VAQRPSHSSWTWPRSRFFNRLRIGKFPSNRIRAGDRASPGAMANPHFDVQTSATLSAYIPTVWRRLCSPGSTWSVSCSTLRSPICGRAIRSFSSARTGCAAGRKSRPSLHCAQETICSIAQGRRQKSLPKTHEPIALLSEPAPATPSPGGDCSERQDRPFHRRWLWLSLCALLCWVLARISYCRESPRPKPRLRRKAAAKGPPPIPVVAAMSRQGDIGVILFGTGHRYAPRYGYGQKPVRRTIDERFATWKATQSNRAIC